MSKPLTETQILAEENASNLFDGLVERALIGRVVVEVIPEDLHEGSEDDSSTDVLINGKPASEYVRRIIDADDASLEAVYATTAAFVSRVTMMWDSTVEALKDMDPDSE